MKSYFKISKLYLRLIYIWLKIISLTIYYNTIGQITAYIEYRYTTDDFVYKPFKWSKVYVYEAYENDLDDIEEELNEVKRNG